MFLSRVQKNIDIRKKMNRRYSFLYAMFSRDQHGRSLKFNNISFIWGG